MLRGAALMMVLVVGGCDVFRGASGRPRTELSEREFIEVYVALAKAHTPEAKAQVLKQHDTSEAELKAFMQAYTNDLPALSAVFDSIVARQGTPEPELPM
jgi:hypothetical protein